MQPLCSNPPEIKGNPWPRRWQPKDQDVYLNDVYFEDDWRFLSKVTLFSKEDFLLLKKYYNKKIKYICVSNIGIPRSFAKRCKYVRELKIFNHTSIKCPFNGIRKMTINIHGKSIQNNPELKRIIKRNKHISSLRVGHFEIFNAFNSSLKALNRLTTFYLDSKEIILTDIMKVLVPFLKSNIKLEKIGLLMKDMWLEGEYDQDQPIESMLQSKYESYQKLFDSILNRKNLKILKLDLCSYHFLENEEAVAKNLIERIAQKQLEEFDIRINLPDFSNIGSGVKDMLSRLHYFALTTDGDVVLSVFGDAEERLRLQRDAKRMLMLNFEGSSKFDLLDCLQNSFKELVTLDLQFKGEEFTVKEKGFHQPCFGEIKNMLLYFELCSSKISQVLHHLSKEPLPSMNHLGLSLKNLNYDEDIYNSIHNFLKPLNHISYLNLLIHHSLKTDRYKQPKIKIERIYSTVATLHQLKTLKLSANPPWDTRPIMSIAPILNELPLLQEMSFFLWLKTNARVLFSFDFPSFYLPKMKDLTISIYFRLEEEFFNQLEEFLSKLVGLERLNLSIVYYNQVCFERFKGILERLGKHKHLKEVQMMLNVTHEERDKKVESIQEAIRRGNNGSLEALVAQMNQELAREKQEMKREVLKLFEEVKSLKKLLFLHAVKQHFSIAHSR